MKKFHEEQSILVLAFILGFFLLLAVPHTVSLAQVTTAITPSGLNTQVGAPTPLPSGQVMHDITGGTRPGNGPNLFHSFGEFSVGPNHTANFLNDSGLATSNILSRVTGGNPSNIFGTLQTTGFGNANLFLMNPAGVVFGPTASLNVGGSVNISTANYVKLADGVRFNALPGPGDALLSVAPVAAFGFLGSDPTGTITVQGGTMQGSQTLSLVGRDLANGTPGVAVTGGTLSNPSGRINLVSVGTPQNPTAGGEINVSDLSPSSTNGFNSLGSIALSNANVNTIGFNNDPGTTTPNNGGTVFIRGGQLTVSNSSITADAVNSGNFAQADAGTIEVHAGAVTLDQATISANSDRNNGGQIRFLDLDTLSSTNSGLSARAVGRVSDGGTGGFISLGSPTTNSIALTTTRMDTTSEGFGGGPGPPGDITLTGRSLSINGGSLDASPGGHNTRPGGQITLNADQVAISNQARLLSRDTTGGGGGGNIIIQGLNSTTTSPVMASSVDVSNQSLISVSGILGGRGGNVTIHSSNVTLNNSTINAAGGFGQGGTISLVDVTSLTSTASTLTADVPNSNLRRGGTIVLGSGNTSAITLVDTTVTANPGGSILLNGQSVSIAGGTIAAETWDVNPSGSVINGGSIVIHAGDLTLSNGALLSTRSTSTNTQDGKAGDVTITTRGAFQSAGSTLNASAKQGVGGQIFIQAGNLVFDAGSMVSVQSEGAGNAGTIQLKAGQNVIVKESVVSANSKGAGNAGSIQLKAGNNIQVKDSTVSAQSEGTGNVGTIRLEAGHKVVVKDSIITPSPTIVSGQTTE